MSAQPQVQVTDHPERHRFEITADGELAGFADYRRTPGHVDLVHTEIDPAHQGAGLAGALAAAALDSLRAEGVQVIPSCSYIAEYIRRHPEHLDLVPEADRDRLSAPR